MRASEPRDVRMPHERRDTGSPLTSPHPARPRDYAGSALYEPCPCGGCGGPDASRPLFVGPVRPRPQDPTRFGGLR